MNIAAHRHSSRAFRHSTLLAAAVSGLLALTAGSANADESKIQPVAGVSRSLAVHYEDLDLATEEGSRELYARIVTAAGRVCPERFSRDLTQAARGHECFTNAVARAVSEVGNAQLAAVAKVRRAERG